MTVNELIAKLQALPERERGLNVYIGCDYAHGLCEITDFEVDEHGIGDEPMLVIGHD